MNKISKFKKFIMRSRSPRIINRFKKNEDGATAVEFALVGGPFFLLIFAIIESSLLFFANQYLETVVDDVARLYRTDRMVNVSPAWNITTQQGLRDEMCERIVALFDCDKLIYQVDTQDKFSELPPAPNSNDAVNGVYAPVERFPPRVCPEQVLQFTASYMWPIYANYAAPLVSDGLDKAALISVTAVVRTEDFTPPPGC